MTPDIERTLLQTADRLQVTPYWVGGPVRDRLLHRTCHDWDIVTRHAQRFARAVARRLHGRLITLDEHYRIYRLIHADSTIDFAELQGKTIDEDLSRRDFTINAMAVPLRGPARLIDPFHGERDLKKRLLRAVSRRAFQEDPIRLLRAYRFSAQFQFAIDRPTMRWITQESARLTSVARERVREELLRLLTQPQAGASLQAMDRSGLLSAIFPDVEAGRRVARRYYGTGGVVKHLLQSVENVEWILEQINGKIPPNPPFTKGGVRGDFSFLVRGGAIRDHLRDYIRQSLGGFPRSAYLKLAALLHDVGKPATAEMIRGRLRFFGHEEVGAKMTLRILQQLRFSRQESQRVQAWVRHHMRLGSLAATGRVTDKAMARFFRDLGEDGMGMLIVSLGDHYTYLARSKWGKGKDPVEKTADILLRRYVLERERVVPTKMLNGHELMKALHLKPGPVVGRLLDAIQDYQAGGTIKTKDDALRHARKILQKEGRSSD